jgi:hypothetical protein
LLVEVYPPLEPLRSYLDQIGVHGTSDDESDPEFESESGQRGFKIRNLKWRSNELTCLLRTMDVILLALDRNSGGEKDGFRARISSSEKEPIEQPPPTGLPVNFYDSDYLNSLSPLGRKRLKVQSPYDCRLIYESFKWVLFVSLQRAEVADSLLDLSGYDTASCC